MSYLEFRAPFRRAKVESAEDLWDQFMAYRQHSIDTPLVEPKIFNGKEGVVHGNLNKIRPLTLNGLCNFIGISPYTWDAWKKREREALGEQQEHSEFFFEVMMQIESIIYDDQYQGAATDIFNASIISRKLGLADHKDFTSSDGTMSPNREMTAEEYAKELEKRGIPIPDFD